MVVPDPAGRAAVAALKGRAKLWLMVQNALNGTWDGAQAAVALMHDKAATSALLDQLVAQGVRENASGLVVDFEDLPAGAQGDLQAFFSPRRAGAAGATVGPSPSPPPPANPDWSLAAIGRGRGPGDPDGL